VTRAVVVAEEFDQGSVLMTATLALQARGFVILGNRTHRAFLDLVKKVVHLFLLLIERDRCCHRPSSVLNYVRHIVREVIFSFSPYRAKGFTVAEFLYVV